MHIRHDIYPVVLVLICSLGLTDVDLKEDLSLAEVARIRPFVMIGGKGKPMHCAPWQKVAIIVPYR